MSERTRLPAVAGAVLRRVLHPAERSEVLADVTEEYAARSARAGRARARVWLWRQVVSSIPGGVRRGWMRGTTGFESEANRMSANSRCHRNFLVHLDHVRDHGFAGGPFVGCACGPLP